MERCLPNCPVNPPTGREAGLEKLQYVDLTFTMMIEAGRYAFYHSRSGGRNSGWTKSMCQAYLRTCGWNQKEQDLLYAAAIRSYKNQEPFDLTDPFGIATYRFPAAWLGDMPLKRFIEMLMHLLFLGVGESNFKLGNMYMQAFGRAELTFKKATQELLKLLTRYNLSWLLVQPFSGQTKGKLTTGTWVSENELAYIRISKVIYAYAVKRGDKDIGLGSNDLVRMVCSFNALVARVLSHSGVSKNTVAHVDMLLKEFLSCVQELDIRTRYKKLDQFARTGDVTTAASATEDKSGDPWWLKSNYVSCLNLVPTMELLGPLVNFWDGGGKGERYIQEIKPHIPRGVKDGGNFFVRLLERVLKVDCMNKIERDRPNAAAEDASTFGTSSSTAEQTQSLQGTALDDELDDESSSHFNEYEPDQLEEETSSVHGSNNEAPIVLAQNQVARAPFEPPVQSVAVPGDRQDLEGDMDDELSYDGDPDEEHEATQLVDEEEEQWSTPMEAEQMEKARTYYVYRKKADLVQTVERREPITGIIVRSDAGAPVMYLVYKIPGKNLGWYKVSFNDDQGVRLCGLWYAPITIEDAPAPPSNIPALTKLARMASVAIPLRFALGNNHADAHKYCVLTNWWRERNDKGQYVMPSIAFELYND